MNGTHIIVLRLVKEKLKPRTTLELILPGRSVPSRAKAVIPKLLTAGCFFLPITNCLNIFNFCLRSSFHSAHYRVRMLSHPEFIGR